MATGKRGEVCLKCWLAVMSLPKGKLNIYDTLEGDIRTFFCDIDSNYEMLVSLVNFKEFF
jgi:hypothetical protein